MEHADIVVFLGPTLKIEQARQLLDADYWPPARRGDIYRAGRLDPSIIVLIDGAFEGEPAASHLEILWVLSRGVTVFGAASLGALRAAELGPFGMIGHGKIFEAYDRGILERDDAVAIVHGPAELGYPLLSIALVDVWATLDRALDLALLSASEHDLLRKISSAIFYKDLDIDRLVQNATQAGLSSDRAAIVRTVLSSQIVYQKSADAIELLRAIAADERSSGPAFASAQFTMENTAAWQTFLDDLEHVGTDSMTNEGAFADQVELASIGVILSEREAHRRGYEIGETEFQEAARQFRARNNLHKSTDVQSWMETAGLDHAAYVKLIEEEYYIGQAKAIMQQRIKATKSQIYRRWRAYKFF
jgi:hypothetical protein